MNRYQKAAEALEWRDTFPGGTTQQKAADQYEIKKCLINNVSHLRRVRPDLYEEVKKGTKSYNFAYRLFIAERDGK